MVVFFCLSISLSFLELCSRLFLPCVTHIKVGGKRLAGRDSPGAAHLRCPPGLAVTQTSRKGESIEEGSRESVSPPLKRQL
ncbi:hypothetical protein HanRHA438_Chr06g0257221 [Helianthus annuus]|nr:hypothetical protein HanRHA438_Chr06g0257221 [Helianthus annuus]